jgi:glycosyltransferase involved in cell wall biosynthesis
MNILMVFHAPPYPPDLGPSRRHYHELTALLERGHRVSVLSYGDEVDERQFRDRFGEQCAHVRFVPLHPSAIGKALTRCWCMARARSDFARFNTRRFQRALDAMIASADYDLISFSTTMLGSLRLPAGIPLVGDTHNVEFDNLRRAFRETRHPILREYFRVQAALTRREEVAFARRFDLVCATSERDRDVLLAAVPEARVEVIPNGIDLEAHRRRHVVRERGTILFTGLMSYYPNAHGIRRFLLEVFPRIVARMPHARVLVVGADPPAALRRLAGGPVTITGYVPDVRPFFERAGVYVIPLRIGGGTRVKALQAMAMGVPIVSTPLGCEGLNVADEKEVLFADAPAEFADAVVRVLQQDDVRDGLVQRAAERVREYEWSRVGDRLNDVFTAAAVRPAPVRGRADALPRAAYGSNPY